MQEYACPACGARYTSLQALSLIDMSDGLFHCEVCRSVLADAEDGGGGDGGGGGGGGDGGRRERLAEAKALQARRVIRVRAKSVAPGGLGLRRRRPHGALGRGKGAAGAPRACQSRP